MEGLLRRLTYLVLVRLEFEPALLCSHLSGLARLSLLPSQTSIYVNYIITVKQVFKKEKKGGEIVPIRWNAKRVKESTDKLEEALKKAVDPLQEARTIVREALGIPELPGYISQELNIIIGKIDDTVGGGRFSQEGWMTRYIERLRKNIPAEAVKAIEVSEKYGSTQSLI